MLTNSNIVTDIENKLVVISEEREMGRMSPGLESRDTNYSVEISNQISFPEEEIYPLLSINTLNGVQSVKIVNHHTV